MRCVGAAVGTGDDWVTMHAADRTPRASPVSQGASVKVPSVEGWCWLCCLTPRLLSAHRWYLSGGRSALDPALERASHSFWSTSWGTGQESWKAERHLTLGTGEGDKTGRACSFLLWGSPPRQACPRKEGSWQPDPLAGPAGHLPSAQHLQPLR